MLVHVGELQPDRRAVQPDLTGRCGLVRVCDQLDKSSPGWHQATAFFLTGGPR